MKNLNYQLSARLKNVLSPDNGSGMARERTGNASTKLLAVLTTFLMLFILGIGNAWGAEDDTHDYSFLTSLNANWSTDPTTNNFASTYGANWLRNSNATLPTFTYTPSYSVKKVSIKVRQSNNTGSNTIAVSIGGTPVESAKSMGSSTSQFDMEFTASSSLSGEVQIVCNNTSGTGNGKGTFYVASITLTEGGGSTTYDVHWNINGVTETTTNTSGKPTVPSAAKTAAEGFSCGGKVFMGWSALTVSGSAPADLFTEQAGTAISAETTYNAVFATQTSAGSSTPATLSFTYSSHTNWTLSSTIDKNSYYLLQKNCYVESPTISDLSTVTSVVLGIGKFSNKGAGEVSSGNTSYGTFAIPGSTSSNSVTISPDTNPLSGSGKIRITNTDGSTYTTNANQQQGTRLFSVTINYAIVTPPTYANYSTTCCNALGTINGSVTLTQDGTSVTVKGWTYTQGSGAAESNIDYYTVNLYASTDSYASVVKTGTCEYNEKSTGVTLTGLTYGVTYKIKISATGNTGYCPISETLVGTINEVTTETFQLACDIPTNVTASAQTSDGATLSWDDVATNYEYVVDQSSSDPAGSGTAVNGAHSVTLTGLEASTTYYFHVRTSCGNSVFSNWATQSFSTTSASYFTNGATVFIQAESNSAWDASACVKAWFNASGAGGAAQTTYWLYDGTGGNANKKLFATIVPASGNLNQVTLQRFASNCSDHWNDNGTLTKASDGGSNTFRTTCSTTSCVAWNASGVALGLRGDPDWDNDIATFADQGNGVWTATYNNYAPDATSADFKIYASYADWIGNTGSNNNATLSNLIVGSTYNVTATLDVKDHSLVMSKTPVNYQVHFDMNGHGSAISSYTTVTPNSTISAPSDPSESGWTFGGWYTDDACTTGNEWDFANDPVTETMTLHAKWTRTPVIKLNDATENITVAFGDKAVDATTGYTLSFTVSGQYLTENIAIGKSGTDQAMFTVSPTSVTQSEGTAASTTINVTYKPSTTGSHSATLTLSSAGAVNRTVTLSGTAKWKVVWNTNGGEYITTLVDNNTKPTFPDPAPTSCESGDGASTTFIGWTKTTWTGKKNQAYIDGLTGNDVVHVANTTMANVTDNTTEYHAVFALASGSGSATYKKVTSGLSDYSGQYLIVFETDNICFDGSRSTGQANTNLDASGNYKSVVISTSTNPYSIASTSTIDTYSFTISASQTSGKYYIQSASGYYIGSTNTDNTSTGSNELLISTSTTYDNSISVSSGNATITGANNILKCFKQSGQSDRFRYFKTTAGNVNLIQLYKYDPGVTYSNYMTTCCENKVTLNTGSPTNGTVAFSPTGPIATCSSTPSDRQTTVTVTPNAGYELTGWTKAVSGIALPDSTSAISTSSGNTAAQSNTYTYAQNANGSMTVTATFSQILVSSLKLKATQTGESDKIGDDLTMTCYPKEGQTGGNDPLSHSLNVKFHEVLPANALDKEYDWSVRVKATGAADWTNVGFTGNALNTNNIINSYNKSTGNLQIKATTGTAEIKITAHDGSGVTAKVTITIANVSVSSISVDPTTMDVYAGQKKPVTITFSPANATDKAYTTGSYTYVTMRSSGSNPFYIEGNATTVVRNETVTVTSHDGSKTATIDVTVNPLPKATFLDIVHGKTDFLVEGESVLVDGTLTSTVSADGLTVDTEWHTPTHADVSDPGVGHNECERGHLHLVGWILKDWADEHPDATHEQIAGAGVGNFFVPNATLDLSSASVNGKTYYAVWAKVVTP